MVPHADRIRIVPRPFDIHDWNSVEMTPQSIVYRPSARTLMRRLGATLVAAILIALFSSYVFYPRLSQSGSLSTQNFESGSDGLQSAVESLRETMSEDEWRRIQEEAARQREARESEWSRQDAAVDTLRSAGFAIYGAVCGLLALMGILAPLSVLWNRVSIFVSGRNQITVASRGIWSSSCQMTIDTDTRLAVRAVERIERRRHAGVLRRGHRWKVSIEPAPGLALLGTTLGSIEFDLHHQKDRPVEGMPLPPRVRAFAEAIHRMTGLTPGPHVIMDYQGSEGFFGKRHLISSTSGPLFSTRTYVGEPVITSRSIQYGEMSPEMRAQFEAMRARAGAGPNETITAEVVSSGGAITFRDATGTEHTFDSVDEMPDDIRAVFDMMRNTLQQRPDRR